MRLGEIRGKIESAVDDVYYKALSERNCSGDIAPLQYERFSDAVDTLSEILTSMIANNGTIKKIKDFINRNGGVYKFPKDYMMKSAENDEFIAIKLFKLDGDYYFETDDDTMGLWNIQLGDLGDRDLILLAEELGL